MTTTANKLVASVERAKTQGEELAAVAQTPSQAAPAQSAAAPSASPARTTRAPRSSAASPSRATKPAAAAVEPTVNVQREDGVAQSDAHNGGQAVFPERVWPD